MAAPATLPPPPLLAELERPALFLDFDGTLVDIAASPDAIAVPERLAERIVALRIRLEGRMALVSGRGLADLERHLGAMDWCRAGSHGVDCRRADGTSLGSQPAPLPVPAVVALMAFAEERGLRYEAKAHGGALHYREVPEAGGPARVFAERLAERHGLEVKAGKSVVELVRPGADKGGAVRVFMREPDFAHALPIFVGDDLTDEDGFAAADALGGFGVIVGDRLDTCARHRLKGVREVYKWLRL